MTHFALRKPHTAAAGPGTTFHHILNSTYGHTRNVRNTRRRFDSDASLPDSVGSPNDSNTIAVSKVIVDADAHATDNATSHHTSTTASNPATGTFSLTSSVVQNAAGSTNENQHPEQTRALISQKEAIVIMIAITVLVSFVILLLGWWLRKGNSHKPRQSSGKGILGYVHRESGMQALTF